VTFLNSRLKAALDRILADSERPPVILVQGDHGPGSGLNMTEMEKTDVRERYSILNAYYLPGDAPPSQLYESISPVNTFRVVLNRYLGTKYPLLKDESYYTPFLSPYEFTLVDPGRFSARLGQDAATPRESAQ